MDVRELKRRFVLRPFAVLAIIPVYKLQQRIERADKWLLRWAGYIK